jgi:hypothetical protein
MSAPLMQRLAFRQLPPHLKSVLLAMANYAREDGTSCRPSLATLAAWTGRSEDRTKHVVRELRTRGLIVVTRPHAPHRPAEYQLVLSAIESLPSTREPQQLTLFAPETNPDSRFPQGSPAIGGGVRPFSTISTGVHRLPAPSTGVTGTPRSVKRSVYRTPVQRARAPRTGTR